MTGVWGWGGGLHSKTSARAVIWFTRMKGGRKLEQKDSVKESRSRVERLVFVISDGGGGGGVLTQTCPTGNETDRTQGKKTERGFDHLFWRKNPVFVRADDG